METMQPTLKNGRNVWDRVNMPQTEFASRIGRARSEMKKKGLDALLVYGYALDGYADPAYLSNFTIRLPNGLMVIVPRDGEPVLIFEGSSRGIPSAREVTWIQDLRAGDCGPEAAKYLKEKGLANGAVGLAGVTERMPHAQLAGLIEALAGGRVVDATSIMRDMRMVKSVREQDQMRRAGRIVSVGFDSLRSAPLDRMDDQALAYRLLRDSEFEGAEDTRVLVGRPDEADWRLGPPEKRPIREGDVVIVYAACAFERYWAEGVRTFISRDNLFVDAPLKAAGEAYGKIAGELKPGMSASTFTTRAASAGRKTSIATIGYYGLGEGIGLASSEAPRLTRIEKTRLRAGMTVTLRLAWTDNDLGGAMVGNTFLIGAGGATSLT